MGTGNRGGKGLSYRPARLHRLAEFIPWNRFLGSISFKNTGSVFLVLENAQKTHELFCSLPGNLDKWREIRWAGIIAWWFTNVSQLPECSQWWSTFQNENTVCWARTLSSFVRKYLNWKLELDDQLLSKGLSRPFFYYFAWLRKEWWRSVAKQRQYCDGVSSNKKSNKKDDILKHPYFQRSVQKNAGPADPAAGR